MKLIHLADVHLDAKMTAHLGPEKARERRSELLATFLRLVHYAAREGVQAVLIAGDLFDRRQISATARNAVLGAMEEQPQITFFYVTGNHERDGLLAASAKLPSNLKLFGESWRTYEAGPVHITGADLSAANRRELFDSLVLDPARFNIVLLHGQVAAYATDRGAEIIELSSLRNRSIDYLALGHLHTYREDVLPPRGIWCYPGCLEGRGFDECGEHGFVLLDIDTEARTCERQFVPFARRRVIEIPVDVTGSLTTAQIASRIDTELGGGGEESPSGDIWNIVLRGELDIACEINMELLRERFAQRCYALRLENATRLAVDSGAYEKDVSLKGEFVRLVSGDENLSDERKAEIIRCGILALRGEELPL